MMKIFNKLIIFFVLLSLFIYSCNDAEEYINSEDNKYQKKVLNVSLTNYEFLSITSDYKEELKDDSIIQLVDDFYQLILNESEEKKLKSSQKPVYKIINRKKLKSDSGIKHDIAYISMKTNEDNGFAVVCSNKLFPHVIGFVPKGSLLDTINNPALSSLLEESILSAQNIIDQYESLNKDSLQEIAYNKVSEQYNINFEEIIENRSEYDIQLEDNPITKNSIIGYISKYVYQDMNGDRWVFPLLKTTWDQTHPYNIDYPSTTCPDFTGYAYQGRYPAGCVIIALAQAFAYNNVKVFGLRWDMNLITKTPTIPREILTEEDRLRQSGASSLINFIKRNVGTVNYNCEGTGANTKNAIELMTRYYLLTDGEKNKSFNYIPYSVENGRLIIARGTDSNGSNHAYVIDGYYLKLYDKTNPLQAKYYNYIHCNLGWGGAGNGYFSMTQYHSKEMVFRYNVKFYPNVRYAGRGS